MLAPGLNIPPDPAKMPLRANATIALRRSPSKSAMSSKSAAPEPPIKSTPATLAARYKNNAICERDTSDPASNRSAVRPLVIP